MNVGRKLLSELKELVNNITFEITMKIVDLEIWMDMHDKAFDHANIKEEVKEEWLEYHDSIMKS